MPDKSDNFSSFVGVLLLLLFLVISIVPFTLFSAEKPDYEVDFDFGSMGINGYIYDTSTDQKIPKEKVSFWALPNSASSPYEVEKIKVEAPGYVPNYVSNFTKRAINLGFKQLVVIELGRVGLTPANSRQLPKITIKSEPSGCAIYVDGAYKGRTPVQRMEMQAGSHEIKLSKRGYNSWTREIYINSGEHRTFYSDEAKLEKKNKPPKADFIYSPYGPSTEETVHFAARAQDPDGRIDSYRWEFGTGDKDWGEEVNYRYERSGDYTVRLLVEDDGGLTNSITKQVSVQEPNKPPSSDFTYSPPEAMPAEIVHFESQASDPDGYISSLVWQFGDGSSSTSKNPDHQYEESGTYTVTLKVKDQSGATDIERKEIKVTFASPKAKFTIKPKKPRTGDQVILDGSGSTVSDGRIESYKWDLDGDGKPESEKSVPKLTYEYTKAGEYSISLTVTDNSGNADSAERTLIVKNKQQEEIEIDEKYGLVIGISKYKDPSLNLKYAAKDAKTFYELLVDEDIGGFQTDKVEILINKEATRDNIDNALKNLVSKTEKNDLVVIYYSGHGSQGPDHNNDEEDGQDEYYITYETDPSSGDAIYKTGYRDDEFADEVKSLDSNQVVIFLDSCYSGGATKSIKGFSLKGQSAPAPGTVFQDFDFEQAEGRVLFAASQESQTSYEGEEGEIEHGLFTYFLLKGLSGKADRNRDGKITAIELEDYIVPHVSSYVDEHDLPENTPNGTRQKPLVKGRIAVPIMEKGRARLEGTIKYVLESSKASEEKHVMIDLGSEDGVREEDKFLVYSNQKGVQLAGRNRIVLEVNKVEGPHLSVCEVLRAESPVKKGYKVRTLVDDSSLTGGREE